MRQETQPQLESTKLHEGAGVLPIALQYHLEGLAQKALRTAHVEGAEPPYLRAIANPLLAGLPGIRSARELLASEIERLTQPVMEPKDAAGRPESAPDISATVSPAIATAITPTAPVNGLRN